MTLSLERTPEITPPEGPLFIIVMDGIGIGRGDDTDAIHLARTPVFDHLDQVALKTQLFAHGTHVGLPTDADMGNSEVGHNAIGAGRVFAQGAKLVDTAIESGQIFETERWKEIMERAHAGGAVHFIGLLSDGNVHSHIDQLFSLIRACDAGGAERVRLHALTDGRDVGSTTSLDYVRATEALFETLNKEDKRDYAFASGGGRMHVTMDRYEADWSIVERGWRAHVQGEGRGFSSAEEAITTARKEHPGISDQVLPPFVIHRNGEPLGKIVDGDAVIFFNFRGDRAIEITRAFEDDTFTAFDRGERPDVLFAGMMEYDGDLKLPSRYLVAPPAIERTMGEYLVAAGKRQLAVSETQKFGHVTYFWNGNRSGYLDESLERYIEIPSDRVDFSERPWMKAAEVTDAIIEAMKEDNFDLVRVNYANGDMVGHTGHMEATIISVEALNLALERLLPVIEAKGGVALITADHGNADQMYQLDKKSGKAKLDSEGKALALTSHTLNPVPLWIYDPKGGDRYALNSLVSSPGLSNLAATAMTILGYAPPEDYEPSLVVVKRSS